MTSKRKMSKTLDEAKSESDSDDNNPRTTDQATALSKHKTLGDIAKELGPKVAIEWLTAYKDTVGRVVDAKVAEQTQLMGIEDAQPGLPIFQVQEADGEAGSSGTEPPRTPAKTAAVLLTPPSTGNHSDTAHNIVDGNEGHLWTETVLANPFLKARFAALTHEAIGNEVAKASFPKTE